MLSIEYKGTALAQLDRSWLNTLGESDPHVLPMATVGISMFYAGLRAANNMRASGLAMFEPLCDGLPGRALTQELARDNAQGNPGSRLALDGLTTITAAIQAGRTLKTLPVTDLSFDEENEALRQREHFTVLQAELPVPSELQEAVGTALKADKPLALMARLATKVPETDNPIRRTQLSLVTRLADVSITDMVRTTIYPKTETVHIRLTRATTDGVVSEPEDASFRLLDTYNSVVAGLLQNRQNSSTE